MMVLLSVLLALSLFSELLAGPLPQGDAVDRWVVRCSQGLQCKEKPHNPFSSSPCRSPPEGVKGSAVAPNVNANVNANVNSSLLCHGRQQCSLQQVVSASLLLTEPVHGLAICVQTPGRMQRCKQVSFSKSSRRRMEGSVVEVEVSVGVSPGQETRVRVHTVPELCGEGWTGTFHAPECSRADLRKQVPQCITGSLQYSLPPEGRSVQVSVSDMLDHQDYRLRLCLESGRVCSGVGADTLIKKEEAVKKVSLSFSRPLPCLCIEGWSAVMDAPRVRVCPFKDKKKSKDELWFGVIFDPMEEKLSWQPACPVDVVVSLCRMGRDDGVCRALPHAAQTTRTSKVTFTKVAADPSLCVKFYTDSQSWTKCPFKGLSKVQNDHTNPPQLAASCPQPS